jgi:hypothetical protein
MSSSFKPPGQKRIRECVHAWHSDTYPVKLYFPKFKNLMKITRRDHSVVRPWVSPRRVTRRVRGLQDLTCSDQLYCCFKIGGHVPVAVPWCDVLPYERMDTLEPRSSLERPEELEGLAGCEKLNSNDHFDVANHLHGLTGCNETAMNDKLA